MVGMGLDLSDLPEYAGCNDLGTAVLLAQMARARIGLLVLASSMVVYGEGAYDCPVHGPVRPESREPSDLAGPLLFLASKASDFYTGHILYADGGYTAG